MANEKILVVDDEEYILELISFNLTNNGYTVLTANNGIDAVKIAIEEKPNLILLDLMIPGKDGYDVCKEVRSNIEIKNIPIIMLTAKSEEIDKILGLTLKEFELLEILIKNKGKILTRDMLLDKIWGYEYIGETRTVDVHIRYLRKKVEDDDKHPKFIETIRGVGYRFNPNC